jgi:cytochrome c oxidase accessory protein FixG
MTNRTREHRSGRNANRAETEAVVESMYQSREKVYPREIKGRFQSLRKVCIFALLGLFYLLPWVPWGGRQAVLFDLPARQFHIFGLTLWPQDFFYLALLLILSALGLFWVTAIAGRVWCGYACPQTVWTEVFMWMERWTEGDRARRMKLDQAPWSANKLLRKGSKHTLWILFAAWTGFTFVGFFTPITELGARLLTVELGPWETFWGLFYGFATWGNAGFMRENVCLYMCPYARFQSAMFDRNTLIISYDEARGEPRGGRRRDADPRELGLGDCIDCNLCVQVCPTGIDIRDGLQYECIACGACIDACDHVMDRMSYPRGLIRYTTENALEGQPTRVFRPRVIVYGVLLLGIAAALAVSLVLREPIRMDVVADRNALYRLVQNDSVVENVYALKVMNMDDRPHTYRVSAEGLPGIRVKAQQPFEVAPGEVRSVPARVQVERDSVTGIGTDILLTLETVDGSDLRVTKETRFHAPTER